MENNEIQEVDTYLAYNKAISIINTANSMYNEQTKPTCDLMVAGALGECHPIKDVYERTLQYMKDNNLYEKFFVSVLETQYQQSSKTIKQEGSKSVDNPIEGKSGGNTKTKPKSDKINKNILKEFIDKMYNDEDEE